jgi:hypothetical protein
MHRSGPTLRCRLLESLGLFLGKKQDEDHEAKFFQQINEWLITQSGAWDNPAPIRYLLENAEIRGRTTDYIRRYAVAPGHIVSGLDEVPAPRPDHRVI